MTFKKNEYISVPRIRQDYGPNLIPLLKERVSFMIDLWEGSIVIEPHGSTCKIEINGESVFLSKHDIDECIELLERVYCQISGM